MHDTSALNSTTIRIGALTATAAISVLALGFAPVPQVFAWLAGAVIAALVIIVTGPRGSKAALSLPMTGLLALPAVGAWIIRGTSLIWAVVPVLAFVVAAATWMMATNRYAAMTEDTADEPVQQPTETSTTVSIATKRSAAHDNAEATNDESSATAA